MIWVLVPVQQMTDDPATPDTQDTSETEDEHQEHETDDDTEDPDTEAPLLTEDEICWNLYLDTSTTKQHTETTRQRLHRRRGEMRSHLFKDKNDQGTLRHGSRTVRLFWISDRNQSAHSKPSRPFDSNLSIRAVLGCACGLGWIARSTCR